MVSDASDEPSSTSAVWEETYASKVAEQRSWTQARPDESLTFIEGVQLDVGDAILDVGGGASRLVDELVRLGYRDLTVLDLSPTALSEARRRVRSEAVEWIIADVTAWTPTRTYRLWHDRAVFHFLVSPSAQARYVETAVRTLAPGGFLVLATFSHSGPTNCSGLAVRHWSIDELAERFEEEFTLLSSASSEHVTPWGGVQPFTWVLLQRSLRP